MRITLLQNFIGGDWKKSVDTENLDVSNPATGEVIGQVSLSPASEVGEAARAVTEAVSNWRKIPITDRVKYLFKLKILLEEQLEDLPPMITVECGKTLNESCSERQRTIKNIDAACSLPTLMQGYTLENIAPGIDELMVH